MSNERRFTSKEVGVMASRIIEDTKTQIDKSVRVLPDEYQERWITVQEAMKKKGYGFGYACGSELDRSDVAWLAGVFDPIIERYGVLVGQTGMPIVLAGSEGGHVIEEAVEKSGAKVILLREFQISDEDYRHARFKSLNEVLKNMGQERAPKKVAIFSSEEFIPHSHVKLLQDTFGANNVIFDPEILQLIKYEKSNKELEIMKNANIIADAALRGMLAVTAPGMTELEIAGVGDYIMKELGAGRTGFPTIVTAGERGYTVIGPATNNIIQKGDIISLGVSPTFNGYHGVIRRTIKAGLDFTETERKFVSAVEGLYKVVMEAAIKVAKEGLPSNFIDQKGKEYLEQLKLKTVEGKLITPLEPYTFVHNTGCSECQEGYGAVTPYTKHPLGEQVALMIDVALTGFKERGKPLFDILYAVIEDAFWKKGKEIGVYNKLPLNVQHLVGNTDSLGNNINPYFRKFL